MVLRVWDSCGVVSGFATPEEAALSGYSRASGAHAIASVVNEDLGLAVVLLATGPSHLYEVSCTFEDGRWLEGSSGNGWTWAPTDEECDVGYQTCWDSVPDDVQAVRIEFNGQVTEAPATNRMFLWVDWEVPSDVEAFPHVVGHLTGNGWRDIPIDRHALRMERFLRDGPPRGWRKLLPPWGRVKRSSLIR